MSLACLSITRVVRAGASLVVAEPGIQRREIKLVINQVVQSELERARLELLRKHHRQQQRVAVDGFVAAGVSSEGIATPTIHAPLAMTACRPTAGFCTVSTSEWTGTQ